MVLDNPAQRNAMSDAMTASWVSAIDSLAGDPTVRAVVVTGTGTAFCSGGNTGWIASEPDAGVDHLRTRMMAFYRAWLSIRKLEIPTIAAVNGPAIGAGLCLALACDIRYAAEGAKLGAPFVKLGMNPGMAATYLLPNAVGGPMHASCCSPVVPCRPRAAARPGVPGVRNRRLRRRGREDRRRSRRPRRSRDRYPKVALRDGGHEDFESCVPVEALAQPITLATADLQEGIAASREKRAPRFEGV